MFNKNSIIYQVVTDRFDNNNSTLERKITDSDYDQRFGDFLGGTFNGIRNRVSYIKDLGATHILISPVQDSNKYHGYHQTDNLTINPNFGSAEELRKLVDAAHQGGLSVIVDYSPTHISSSHPLFVEKVVKGLDRDKDWFLFKDRMPNSKNSSYYGEVVYKLTSGNLGDIDRINAGDYLGYFGLAECPLLNLDNPEVRDWNKENLLKLMKDFDFDDVRLDSGFLQPRGFIRELRDALSVLPRAPSLLAEYWDFKTTSGQCHGFCDGEFDAETTIMFNNMSHDSDFFSKILSKYYRIKDIAEDYSFVVSLDSHDLPRFRGGDSLQKVAATLQFALPVNPLIYYGNEIGMRQYNTGHDRIAQSRDPMRWGLPNEDMLSFYKRLANFRKTNSFSDARISEAQINDDGLLFTYRLSLGDKNYCVLLNSENRDKPVNAELFFGTGVKLDKTNIVSGKRITGSYPYINLRAESAYLFKEK